jgi:hypothetical protein
MSPFEPLQLDTGIMHIADTRTIALIASKRNFDPDKERRLIEKAKHTVCKCRHFTGSEPCLYRNCRHFADNHYNKGVGMEMTNNNMTMNAKEREDFEFEIVLMLSEEEEFNKHRLRSKGFVK